MITSHIQKVINLQNINNYYLNHTDIAKITAYVCSKCYNSALKKQLTIFKLLCT